MWPWRPNSTTGPDLLRQAGLALQAAKAAGPGETCRYESERHGVLVERMRLREALSRAVIDGAFTLHYQPIVALDTGATVGFEALVRWAHPTRGLVGAIGVHRSCREHRADRADR